MYMSDDFGKSLTLLVEKGNAIVKSDKYAFIAQALGHQENYI